jgi:uncharacterized RDD family membrane protein YckC
MKWFYVDAGQQAGPVPDEQLDELVRGGKVRADTLVWREGLPNWLPYPQARPEGVQPPAPPPPPLPQTGGIPPMAIPAGQSSYAPPVGVSYGLDYAGFWIRFLAKLIDGLIIGTLVGIPIGFILVPRLLGGGGSPAELRTWLGYLTGFQWQIAEAMVGLLFNGFFLGRFGATPGKMALGLKVLNPDGTPIGYGRAFGRSAAEIISRLICFIGYIIAGFDPQKRALHDYMASTRVIKTRL